MMGVKRKERWIYDGDFAYERVALLEEGGFWGGLGRLGGGAGGHDSELWRGVLRIGAV